MKYSMFALLLALAACSHDKLVGPRDCTFITNRGLHSDTTYMKCQK